MGGSSNDTLALPRRAVPWLALLAVIAASPNAREALVEFFRRLLASLRFKLFRPALKKDFLGAGAGRPAWPTAARPALPPRQSTSALGDTPAQRGEAREVDFTHGAFSEYSEVLPAWLSAGLERSGFEALKPIQKKVLPFALAGRDVCGIAPTGSGKTLAFLVPGLVHAAGQPPPRSQQDGPIMLVLAPTRELAVQIEKVAESLMKPSWDPQFQTPGQGGRPRGLNSIVLYGGPRRSDQLSTLRMQQGTHLVVATPGRLLDFLENDRPFNLARCSFFVLDEGDRMLDFGFEPDVTAIAAMIRKDRQMLFFSATWPPEVEAAALKYCSDGQMFETVSVQPKDAEIVDGSGLAVHGGHALPPRDIHQVVEVIEGAGDQWNTPDKKLPMLLRHLEEALGGEMGETPGKALIFVGTRLAAEELGHLVARHFGLDRCGVMHGARKQDQREATLQAFRTGRIRALVATDVLGRGVDIPYVTHVVIYDFPSDIETYIHRVGRTGRNGSTGKSVAFFEPRPWYPELARELVDVLNACGQDVPAALEREASPVTEWGAGWYEGSAAPGGGSQETHWTQDWRKAAPLESDSPPVATAEELGEWDCGGVRVWGYSANGGQTEQGRMELRAGGKLRTTWGWGEWALLPSAPHCPPPRRACPTPGGTMPTPGTGEPIEGMDDSTLKVAAGSKPGAAPHLSLTWGGCTDVVALDANGLGFELVSRSGRPASTQKKKTLGRALPDITL